MKTHWKRLTSPDYIGSWDFQPGEEKIVTIKEVRRDTVFNPSKGGKEECTVAYFEEPVKPLILNTTNSKTISKVWGTPYIEDWVGCKIALRVRRVSAFGEMVDAVRVSPDRPAEEAIICEGCGNEIGAEEGHSAQDIARATMAQCGKKLCLSCARKMKEENNG